MLRNEGEPLTRVVVTEPGSAFGRVTDPAVHGMLGVPDLERARRQHETLCAVLGRQGAEVVVLTEPSDLPNAVFARDSSLVTPMGHIHLRMGLPSRRGEAIWMSQELDRLSAPLVGGIEEPGTVEGGDVILMGDVAFVGSSSRTNEEGLRQLNGILAAQGYEVRIASVSDRYMHIGGLMSTLGPRRVLRCRGLFPEGFFDGFETVDIDWYAPSCANVICLRPDEVVADASENGPTIEVLEQSGVTVHALDLSEFRTAGGGPSCLILPLERVPGY